MKGIKQSREWYVQYAFVGNKERKEEHSYLLIFQYKTLEGYTEN